MTEERLVHKIGAIPITEKFELQWFLTEDFDGRTLSNQIFVGRPTDEDADEPELDILLHAGSMAEARRLWNNLSKLIDLIKGNKEDKIEIIYHEDAD